MGLVIEDGTGKGYTASVSSANKLRVAAVISTQEHYANHNQGRAYNLNFSATPTSGACFLYMKNTDTERDLSIEGIWLFMQDDDYFDIKLNDTGTPTGGSTVTARNLNTGSGMTANGTFLNGGDIGGLSGGGVTHRIYHANSDASVYWNFNQDLILASNGVFTMYAGAKNNVFRAGIVVFNYHAINN